MGGVDLVPTSNVVKMDARGRLSLGTLIQKNGLDPAPFWIVEFGADQSLTLRPAEITPAAA